MSDIFNTNLYQKNNLGLYSDCLHNPLRNQHMGLLLKNLKDPKVILDVGCNDGSHSLLYKRTFSSAKIYSFEPDPRAIAQYKINLEPYSNWELYEGAVGDIDGTIKLNIAFMGENNWSLSSSIVKSVDGCYGLVFKEYQEVPCITLDTWVKEKSITCIDFAHTDLQGSEGLFIKGAANAFKITHFIMMEYGEVRNYPSALTYEDTIARMGVHGFKEIYHKGSDILFQNQNWNG